MEGTMLYDVICIWFDSWLNFAGVMYKETSLCFQQIKAFWEHNPLQYTLIQKYILFVQENKVEGSVTLLSDKVICILFAKDADKSFLMKYIGTPVRFYQTMRDTLDLNQWDVWIRDKMPSL